MKTKPNNKSVIYARVSSKEQEETGYSLESQEKLLREYSSNKGFRVERVFSISESASHKNQREKFGEMMKYIDKNNINIIICEKVDRLTRNLKDAVAMNSWIEESPKRQIHLVKDSLVMHKESRSQEKLNWNIRIIFAQNYTDNLSEEVKKGQKEKLEQGWLPTKPPLGYRTVGEKGRKTHEIEESVAPLIKDMFELYATGNYSTRELSRVMGKKGLKNSKGNSVGKTRIYDLLSDPFYCGDLRWKGEIYSGSQEPIISRDLFNLVQNKLNRKLTSPYFSVHRPVYRGKIKCGECDRTISWEKQKGHWYGGCKNCKAMQGKRRYIRQEVLDEEIVAKMVEVAPKSKRVLEILERALKEGHSEEIELRKSQIDSINRSLARGDRRMEVAYEDRLDRRISPEEYDVRKRDWENEKLELVNQLKKVGDDRSEYYEVGYKIHELALKAKDIYKSPKTTTDERRLLLSYIFSNLTIKQGKITPEYTKAFKFLQEWMPKVNESFELEKSVVNKRQKGTFVPPCPVLLRE